MRNGVFALLVIVGGTLSGCGKKSDDHSHHHEQEAISTDPNKALSDSVMDVHNEVMPRMDEMFRLTESLKDKIAKTPDMPAAKKQEIEVAIDSLDHASEGMMVWMRQYKPEANATDGQAARAYLNNEMTKVSRVKNSILSAIEKGKSLQ